MVDVDGRFSYSKVVSVQWLIASCQLTISPNPVKDIFTLQLGSEQSEKVVLELINTNGKVLQQQTLALHVGTNKWNMAMNALAKGSYRVIVKTANRLWQQQLIKE